MKRLLPTLILGLAGLAVLVSLGAWQVQRMGWKEAILAEIEARIAADPVPVPARPDPEADKYLPVTATGQITGDTVRILVSTRDQGAGYRLINALDMGGRRVLLDRGYLRVGLPLPPLPEGPVRVLGNLHWPEDRDSHTPQNDLAENIWFARDLAPLAAQLGAEPVLIVARSVEPGQGPVLPLPVTATGIPNNHLSYAVQWFAFATIWTLMVAAFIWRQRQTAANPAKGN